MRVWWSPSILLPSARRNASHELHYKATQDHQGSATLNTRNTSSNSEMAHLGLGRLLFGAPPAAGTKMAAPPQEDGEGEQTTVKQHAANDQGAAAGQVAGERRQMGDEVGDVAKLRKKKGAPIVVHHFPFHSRPGLL